MIARLIALCGVILMATTSAAADSGRTRDREGQITEPGLAAQEKARKARLEKLTIAELKAAIQRIIEQEKGKTLPVIEFPAPPPKKS